MPWLPQEDHVANVEATKILLSEGLTPVPHIVARNVVDHHHLEEVIGAFRDVLGGPLENALVLAGSRASPVGQFADSLQILQTGVFREAKHLYCAVHPSGHAHASDAQLDEAFKMKVQLAGAETQVQAVTQLCLNPDDLVRCAMRLRVDSILVGIAPRMDFERLKAIMTKLDVIQGVNISSALAKAKGNADPAYLQHVVNLFANVSGPRVRVGFHVYGLSSFKNTMDAFSLCETFRVVS